MEDKIRWHDSGSVIDFEAENEENESKLTYCVIKQYKSLVSQHGCLTG